MQLLFKRVGISTMYVFDIFSKLYDHLQQYANLE